MSLFTEILEKLGLKKDKAGTTASTPARETNKPSMPGSRPGAVANPAASDPADPKLIPQTGAAAAPVTEVDVVKKLETLGAGKGLNWKASIVDLLKLLDIDTAARPAPSWQRNSTPRPMS